MTRSVSAVIFGEILFDVFPDGAHLGGAPLNLSVHLHRQGASVRLISAVGADELGSSALAEIERQGLSAHSIARLPSYPTGRVDITLSETKIPTYRFTSDCAYDHIPVPPDYSPSGDLFCFGTLAQRGEESRRTLFSLLEHWNGRVFCDVNLRQNFYSPEILERSLEASDWIKLNDEELPVLAKCFGLPPKRSALAERFNLEIVLETLGPKGCMVLHRDREYFSASVPAPVVSTVGAGDSFSAAFLYHMLNGSDAQTAADAGNLLASKIVAQTGAF